MLEVDKFFTKICFPGNIKVYTQYIMLLKKVMPKVIEEEGGPSEF